MKVHLENFLSTSKRILLFFFVVVFLLHGLCVVAQGIIFHHTPWRRKPTCGLKTKGKTMWSRIYLGSTDGFPLFSPGQHGKDDVSNPKNQAERAPILLSRAWSGLDTSFPVPTILSFSPTAFLFSF